MMDIIIIIREGSPVIIREGATVVVIFIKDHLRIILSIKNTVIETVEVVEINRHLEKGYSQERIV